MALSPEISTSQPEESDPSAISAWMKDMPSLEPEETPPTPPKKEEGISTPPDETKEAGDAAKQVQPPAKSEAKVEAKPEPPVKEKGKEKGADDEEEDKWPRSSDDWAKFRAKRKAKEEKLRGEISARESKLTESQTRISALEKELADTKEKVGVSDPDMKAELERLKKENEEYSTRLAVTDVVSHPKFQAHFKGRMDEQMDEIRTIFEKDKAEEVIKALDLPEGDFKKMRLEELINDMTPFENSQFGGVLKELRKIERDRIAAIADAKAKKEKLDAETKTAAEKRFSDNKKVFSEVIREAQDPKGGIATYQLRDGDDKWNAGVKERVKVAERLLFGGPDVDPKEIMRGALDAAAFPALMQSYINDRKALESEIAKLQAQVKELSAAQPAPGAGTESPAGGAKPGFVITKATTPQEASKAFFDSLHQE